MERKAVWEKISALLRTYEKLYLTDQVFLLEAVEHVQFGQINTTASVVQRLVKDVMEPAHKYNITCTLAYDSVYRSLPSVLNTLGSCKPSHCSQQYVCVLCLSSGGLTGVRHAMVMVNTKVLTTYGRYLLVFVTLCHLEQA